MKRHWKVAAFAAAVLGMALPPAAQAASSPFGGGPATSGGGTSTTGSTGSTTSSTGTTSSSSASSNTSAAGTTGPASGGTGVGSSSPGIGRQGESETGVGVPSTAPVDNRTQQPVEIGTGEPASSSSDQRPGYGSNFYTDLSRTGAAGTAAGTGAGDAGSVSNDLRDGLEKLHAGNQAEIESGQLAQQNATSPDVKAFGERMVNDHSQNDQQLSGMAQTLGVDLEGKAYQKQLQDARKARRKLEGKSGSSFDRAYVSAMIDDHQKDAKDVKKLADKARKDGQGDLASFLDQTEQTIRGHLSDAKQLESSVRNASNATPSLSGSGS